MTAACSTAVSGIPSASTTNPAIAPGSYNTAPRSVIPPDDEQRLVLAANYLGERIISATDVDQVLTRSAGYLGPMMSAENAAPISNSAPILRRNGYRYSFRSVRQTADYKEMMSTHLLQTDTPDHARTLADEMRTATGGGAVGYSPNRRVPIADATIPGAGSRSLVAITSVGSAVAYLTVFARTNSRAQDLVGRAVDLQADRLGDYHAPDGDLATMLTADRDRIVSYTVRSEAPSEDGFFVRYGYRSAHVQALDESDTVAAKSTFDRLGVDLVGMGLNTVYRARSTADAISLRDFLADQVRLKGVLLRTGFSVDHVTGSMCHVYRLGDYASAPPRTNCFVARGRYVSAAEAPQTDQAQQITAAAYLILGEAR
ncbi:hypothetical protein FK268_06415 [Tsukamurella sputi]|uniref:Uncharacterized protein n=1 Tax=Tsukamurella sputi TaxID=2591848 RepID=A0A5C5RQS1_9ACTN|nr:hypothetical protein [Tsukamurella sputi]TWS24873.1 hypothetical protein FK268_06415 [Tsukamurella sputi]